MSKILSSLNFDGGKENALLSWEFSQFTIVQISRGDWWGNEWVSSADGYIKPQTIFSSLLDVFGTGWVSFPPFLHLLTSYTAGTRKTRNFAKYVPHSIYICLNLWIIFGAAPDTYFLSRQP